ncbi:hypothetical protein [Bacillus sp. M6-12]|uniref:hypothetical protein n=1 Tax=Bacillus sp. M6-12 TaxID=2054166 RepID=UPI0015E07783|nr:hypothetical protein [Bacillus sp. M6-12]
MGAKTIQEVIDMLNKVDDKTQTLYVWNRYGYYGTDLTLEVAKDQDEKPLILESN